MTHEGPMQAQERKAALGIAHLAFILSLLVSLGGCGGDGSPAGPDGDGSPGGPDGGGGAGTILVTTSTTNNLDPNGFRVTLDGANKGSIGVNGTLTLARVPAGTRSVALTGIAPNCSVDGGEAKTVAVADGSTENVGYTVTCVDPPEGRIFFRRAGQGRSWISVMNADGTGVMDLKEYDGAGGRITFSPDGGRVAFTDWRNRLQLLVMGKDGSDLTQLTSDGDWYEGTPAWSPDGQKIAFNVGPDNFQIAVMDADGSAITQLTDHPEHYSSMPDWSPDGARIAFRRQTRYQSLESDDRIYVMNADGSDPTPLTEPAPLCDDPAWGQGWPLWHDHEPKWSPDGNRILFIRYSECDPDPTNDYQALYVMNADGTEPRELAERASPADWSPDGSQIVYIQGPVDDMRHIYVMNADGTGKQMILESHGWDQGEEYITVAWSR
jgi:Tol biopolymer transport system component